MTSAAVWQMPVNDPNSMPMDGKEKKTQARECSGMKRERCNVSGEGQEVTVICLSHKVAGSREELAIV